MKHVSFSVAPRYTPGSPAQVDELTARRVAEEERQSLAFLLEGCEGPDAKTRAERLGLRGISEQRMETGAGKKQGWRVLDLCTGETFFRLCAEALRKLGWVHYADLVGGRQAQVDKNPPTDIEDHRKGWYKFQPWEREILLYRPEKVENDL